MSDKNTDFNTFCVKGTGEKCDLHFLVENEILTAKGRLERLEDDTKVSFDELQKTLNNFIVEVRSYIGSQGFRDRDQDEVKSHTRTNTNEIIDLKISIKSMIDNSYHVTKTVSDLGDTVKTLSDTMKDMDRFHIRKDDVIEIVDNIINKDKNISNQKWFESIPAKISATATVVSVFLFYTIKIILMIMAALH
jgi:hypothetical protein